MRLHSLAIKGFGPFAGSEHIDLDALASSGLFLIHGPTGAGKSSILDAICFALYAAVPGARAGARASLRSDHAGDGVIPEVTLEFTAAGRRLRVCRSPEFSRPKKRGAGDTTVPARVVLEEYTQGAWSCLGTRHDEVALLLKDILGMGLEQFIKVVLLPQGDFAAFLRASPEDRRLVLEKLFDTRRFTDMETWLVERRRQTAAAMGTARDQLSTGLLRVDDVVARLDAGDDLTAPLWSNVLPDDVTTDLARLVAAVELRASSALSSVEICRTALARTESAVHRGAAVLGHQQTAGAARARLAALDEQLPEYEHTVRRVSAAERAGAVSGFVATVHSATLLRDAASANVADLREPLALIPGTADAASLGADSRVGADTGFEGDGGADDVAGVDGRAGADAGVHGGSAASVGAGAIHGLIDRVAGHSDALQQAVSHASRMQTMAQESAQHRDAAQLGGETSAVLARQRAEAESRRGAAEQARDAGRAAAAALPGLEARHKSLSRIQALLRAQQRSALDLEALQRQADSADRQSLVARERLVDLRERRLAGMAAELANGLVPGGPCPVCGSCAHPTPAFTTDVVSPANIRSAEADQGSAAEALSLVRAKVAAEVSSSQARLLEIETHQPAVSAAEVPESLAAATAAIEHSRAAAAALTGAQSQVVALTQDVEQLQARIEAAATARAASLALASSTRVQSEAAESEVKSLLDGHRQSCPCHTEDPDHPMVDHGPDHAMVDHGPDHAMVDQGRGADEVAWVTSHHRDTLAQLRLLATGLHELETQDHSARAAVVRLSTALQDNGFEALEQAQAAALPAATVVELTAQLRAAEQQRAQATALLAQPDVVAAVGLPTPDADALAEAHSGAAASLTLAGRRHTLSEQAQRDLRALSATVQQALAALGPAESEARLVQELADCVTGNSADNALRMRLSSYVLAARRSEIATLANERLGPMSDGRYTLEYTDARAAKGARSGLGLLVRDAWTGQPRETSSLSGGEAFMASLALALGLGDAVRAEAGGFDLQTLFVDEGFGSLDEESLEQVMAVLDTLREGGRAVGIVSHVSELRQRIPQQLHVLKQQDGSTIRVDCWAPPPRLSSRAGTTSG